jgi:phosphoglycerol transferase MdoB-like AlkP superfamily enzyme
LPERYKGVFPKGEEEIQEAIAYTDFALRRFFEEASRQPWYKNTLFVLTADHCSTHIDPYYKTSLGYFNVPIIFYAPGDSTLHGIDTQRVVEQIDIMPTVLSYLGYADPYVAFGTDLLHTPDADTWAINNNNGMYQYVKGDYVMQFTDEGEVKAIYNYRTDWFLHNNLKGQLGDVEAEMERTLKAIIQQYMVRMTQDRMLP